MSKLVNWPHNSTLTLTLSSSWMTSSMASLQQLYHCLRTCSLQVLKWPEKQMPCVLRFLTIQHSVRMMNCIPIKVGDELMTPFELIHHTPPDSSCGSGYFHHTQDGIVQLGFKPRLSRLLQLVASSNSMVFFNPRTKSYMNRTPTSWICLAFLPLYGPRTHTMTAESPPISIKTTTHIFPSPTLRDAGSRSQSLDMMLPLSAPSNIPLKTPSSNGNLDRYMILLDNGTMHLSQLSEFCLILYPQYTPPEAYVTLPVFFAHSTKVTMAHKGSFHKGFLLCLPGSSYQFLVQQRLSFKHEEWGANLPNFQSKWLTMCQTHQMIPS